MAPEEANEKHAGDDEDDVEEQRPVGQESIDAQHGEHGGIVAGKVAQIVVDTGLSLAEAGRLGDALEIKELRDGLQIGEAIGHGSRAQAFKTVRKIETRRNDVERNLNARHDVEMFGGCWVLG